MKRVLAIIGIIILLGLYVATLVVAIDGGPNFLPMLQACLVATVAVPVIIHLFLVMKNVRDGGSVFDNPYSYRKAPSDENSGGNDESKSDLENKES
ncbi:MAG: hypothetical protein IJM23_01645 [Lachnospiraceae bacterium]|nr:hypothetical protein [Lachnospiraceae bacterium]